MNVKQMAQMMLVILFMLSCIFVIGQEVLADSKAKVGGLELPNRAFGVFGTARHANKDTAFTNYVNYYAEFALWVGAVNSKGKSLVSAGAGNSVVSRSEWTAEVKSFAATTNTGFSQVEEIATTSFSDLTAFTGHIPLGLQVAQTIYGFKNTGFALVDYAITLDSAFPALKGVYVGLWSDVDAPDKDNRNSPANDKVGFALKGKAPFIFDSSITGTENPLLGAMILGVAKPIVSWWTAEDDPQNEADMYSYLQGNVNGTDPEQASDFRFLLSYGPINLQPGETVHLPVTIAQSPQLSDFADNLNDAQEFFTEELGGITIKKLSSEGRVGMAAMTKLPETFQLYQNFPNPFNPETQIQFDLPQAAEVKLHIYNTVGQLVRNLVDRAYSTGSHKVVWNGRNDQGQLLSSGLYVYQIQAGDFKARRKLLLLK